MNGGSEFPAGLKITTASGVPFPYIALLDLTSRFPTTSSSSSGDSPLSQPAVQASCWFMI